MADISKVLFLRHLRGTPTAHIRHLRGGRVVHDGIGLTFWYRPRTAVISEIPLDDRELPLLFHARTRDFQDIAVQATVTFRIADPAVASNRLDFGVDPEKGTWRTSPLDQLAGLITETAQQHAFDLLAQTALTDALVSGVPAVRARIHEGLVGDQRLAETGIAVVGVRVVAVRPEADMEKALRTPVREQVQTEADRATYSRRVVSVEQERRIAENEMQNQIELARREEQLVTQRGANDRLRASQKAAAERIAVQAQAEGTRVSASARAEATRLIGAAEGEAETARVAALRDLDRSAVIALAVRDLAGNLPEINTLAITPDLVTTLLARLAGTGGLAPALSRAPAVPGGRSESVDEGS
ncbi:SPFH domain-containing protein [Frankia sp. Cppng1_Ct_nod]|uniref:SPFH domain-containing protein n=1 Tax=Frankia sp. Cppng1_Ct_nod TaxID=2897162 RepID=UPI0010413465|nr:SPFH domain-containing protein [Frankia sp. Cppng1_Ct_nod]